MHSEFFKSRVKNQTDASSSWKYKTIGDNMKYKIKDIEESFTEK